VPRAVIWERERNDAAGLHSKQPSLSPLQFALFDYYN